jgi:hypothetical protein
MNREQAIDRMVIKLEKLYELAVAKEKIAPAVRILELIAKLQKLFAPSPLRPGATLSMFDMTNDQIDQLMDECGKLMTKEDGADAQVADDLTKREEFAQTVIASHEAEPNVRGNPAPYEAQSAYDSAPPAPLDSLDCFAPLLPLVAAARNDEESMNDPADKNAKNPTEMYIHSAQPAPLPPPVKNTNPIIWWG